MFVNCYLNLIDGFGSTFDLLHPTIHAWDHWIVLMVAIVMVLSHLCLVHLMRRKRLSKIRELGGVMQLTLH